MPKGFPKSGINAGWFPKGHVYVRNNPPKIDRVMARVIPVPESGCWIWEGYTEPDGYGRVILDTVRYHVHKFVWEHFNGPVPPKLQLDHLCRVRCCANPSHLEVVTGRVNSLRGESPAAHNARKTHCLRGHEFTQENTYLFKSKSGYGRLCRQCGREHALKYSRENKVLIKQRRQMKRLMECHGA